MSGYAKLFQSILDSSIWCEDSATRLVWITMLAMKNRDGNVEAAVPGLANRARVSIEDCRKALQVFLSPDPESRSKDHEGRRIKEIPGGWHILNHEVYRDKMSAADRREYWKNWKREARKKEKQLNKGLSAREVVTRNVESDSQ